MTYGHFGLSAQASGLRLVIAQASASHVTVSASAPCSLVAPVLAARAVARVGGDVRAAGDGARAKGHRED
eukprot:6407886-Lingulodinium_polyedra.AAC.1